MFWITNILAHHSESLTGYISRGMVMGRPRPRQGMQDTVESLEKDGWIGVYDPNKLDTMPVAVGIDLGRLMTITSEREPKSNIDNGIKKIQQDLKNPAKYRARWTGTRYVYEPIENTPK